MGNVKFFMGGIGWMGLMGLDGETKWQKFKKNYLKR